MDKTGEHVYRGLAGLFIIDDQNSDSLNLPAEYGVDDLPLVIQDSEFDQDTQFVYQHDRKDVVGHTGMLGDTILVNGTIAPTVEVPAILIRLRLINGSNARRYNFGFSDNRPFYQIATVGGLLPAPVERTRLVLASGERAEEVVQAGEVEIWEVTSLDALHPFHVHGVQFLILDRNGTPPADYEHGWKDTVLVQRDETVRLFMRMPVFGDSTLPFMFHGHILEHEDMGMMGQFIVVDDLSQEIKSQSPLLDLLAAEGMEHEE